jgi:phospholipid N-methyltransferase
MGFSRVIFESVYGSPHGKISAIADLASLEVIEGLSYFYPKKDKEFNTAILEVGSGIGTVTRLLLKVYNSNIVCYEVNDFCLSQLWELKEKSPRKIRDRMIITSNLLETYQELAGKGFSFIFIDGPIRKSDLALAIKNSKELQFIFVQGWRLIQRLQISFLLFRNKQNQQYVEIRHENRVTCAIFFVNNLQGMNRKVVRSFLSFISTNVSLLPKIAVNIIQSRGRNLWIGKRSEDNNRKIL